MSQAIIGYDDIVRRSATVIAATNVLATLPAANLAHRHLAKVARFSGAITAITVDAGASVTAGAMLLAGLNSNGLSSTRIRASDTDFTTGDLLDTDTFLPGVDVTYKVALHVFAADVTARYWQVDITGFQVTRLEIGIMALLPVLRPGDGLRWPLEHRLDDLSETAESLGGQATSYRRARLREASFSFAALTENEAYSGLLTTLDRAIGSGGDVLLVPDPAGAQWAAQTIWGRLTDLGGVRHQTLNLYEHAYRIREVG